MVGKSNLFELVELVFPSGVFFLESGGPKDSIEVKRLPRNFLEIVGGSP